MGPRLTPEEAAKCRHIKFRSVFNVAARIIFSARRSDHVTSLLRELHWLRVPERIQYKLCVRVCQCLHGAVPNYLADTLHLVVDVDSRRRLRSASSSTTLVPPTCSHDPLKNSWIPIVIRIVTKIQSLGPSAMPHPSKQFIKICYNVLSNPGDQSGRQTNRQTDRPKNITSFLRRGND